MVRKAARFLEPPQEVLRGDSRNGVGPGQIMQQAISPETLEAWGLNSEGLEGVTFLARGGMSEIYSAIQTRIGRKIALKRLRPELQSLRELRERFHREAQYLGRLNHPHLPQVYNFICTPQQQLLILELVEGIDLSEVLRRVGPLPPLVASALIVGLCYALEHVHLHNLVHRDIKPANIRINYFGKVKLMDFGIAWNAEDNNLTKPGVFVGSPHYLAPEHILVEPSTPRSDLFLLGITFFEMLTGRKPFEETHEKSVYQAIREGRRPRLRDLEPGIPRALDLLVSRCLKINPSDRFSSVAEFRAGLEAWMGIKRVRHTTDLILSYFDYEGLLKLVGPYHSVSWELRRGWWNWLWRR